MSERLRTLALRLHVNLWTLIIAPTVWALHFLLCYVATAIHCAKAGRLESLHALRPTIVVATVVALLVVAIAGYVAWAHSTIEGDPPPHQESTYEDRARDARARAAGASACALKDLGRDRLGAVVRAAAASRGRSGQADP